jgi:hypothetical protein
MGLLDDYLHEMDALSPDLVEAVLAGRAVPEPAAARVAALVESLRGAPPEEPTPEVAERHLAAMAAAAQEAGLTRSRRLGMHLLTRRRIGGLAVAATLMLGGGIAAALTLPEEASDIADHNVPAEPAIEAGMPPVQVQQGSAHGQAVSQTARTSAAEGCEKGQEVAEVASENADEQGPAVDPCTRGDGQAEAQPAGTEGSSRGEEASTEGHAIAEQAKSGGKAFGEATAGDAPVGGEGLEQPTTPGPDQDSPAGAGLPGS